MEWISLRWSLNRIIPPFCIWINLLCNKFAFSTQSRNQSSPPSGIFDRFDVSTVEICIELRTSEPWTFEPVNGYLYSKDEIHGNFIARFPDSQEKTYLWVGKKNWNQYSSLCVELDVASWGITKKEALDNLRRTIETYIKYMIDDGHGNEVNRPVPMNELRKFLYLARGY